MAGILLLGQVLAGSVAGLGTIALSSRLGLAPERALAVAGGLAALLAACAGFLAAARKRKVGFWESLVSGSLFTAATTWILGRTLMAPFGLYRPFLADLYYLANMFGHDPRAGVAVAALAIAVVTFVGCTVGYLLAGSGKLDLRFSFEGYVAQRHLRLVSAIELAAWGALLGLALPVTFLALVLAETRLVRPVVEFVRDRMAACARSATTIMTVLSVGGVMVGVMALTVVLSVMSGFEQDLKQKIIGTNAHAVVLRYGNEFKEWPEAAEKVRSVRGVTGVTPFILNEVMVSSDQNISGALIKGIDPKTASSVTNLGSNVKEGSFDWLEHPEAITEGDGSGDGSGAHLRRLSPSDESSARKVAPKDPDQPLTIDDIIRPQAPHSGSKAKGEGATPVEAVTPGILIGKELAHSLKVMVGDRINVVSPLGGELGPSGPMPKSRPFRVAGIFVTGMYEYDAKSAYIALSEAQSFFNMPGSVTGLELKTDDIDNTRQITRSILATLDGYPYRTKDWGEMNKNLFSALRLEKLVMAIILVFIVLVACVNILSTLIMMVLEKSKEISILKSMGSTDTSVMKVFVLEGLIIGALGTAFGLIVGYFLCLFVEVVGIHLDAEVYYIDKLPVRIDALQFAVVALIAVTLSYLATIYPAARASRVAPVDGLRNE